MKKATVKAAPLDDPALKGKRKVCKEGTQNRWITEHEPVEVELTAYYLRRLNRGELVMVGDRAKPKPVKMKTDAGKSAKVLKDNAK